MRNIIFCAFHKILKVTSVGTPKNKLEYDINMDLKCMDVWTGFMWLRVGSDTP
jgi:hypothetical protein